MAGPRRERDRGSEGDLFDDLDEFFAPLDESEGSDEDEAARPGPPAPVDPAAAESVEADLDDLQIDIPAEEELLAGADERRRSASEGPAASAPVEGVADDEQPPPEPTREPELPEETPSGEPPPTVAAPTPPPSDEEGELFEPEPDELSLADLELSDTELGVGEGEPVDLPPETQPTVEREVPGEAAAGPEADLEGWDLAAEADWAAAAGEGPADEATPPDVPPDAAEPRGESADAGGVTEEAVPPEGAETPVSVDDLRAPPPQYADLPGPEGAEGPSGEPGAEEPVTPAETGPPAEDAGVTSFDDLEEVAAAADLDVGEPTFPHDLEPGREEAAVPEPSATEPGSVEQAADHFAEGIPPDEIERELLADLGPPPDETVRIDTEGAAAATSAGTPDDTALQPEPLGAPTWEEEGAHPLQPEVEEVEQPPAPVGPGARRNLVAAFASGILLAAMVIALLVIGKGPFAVFAGAVVLLGQAEFYAVMRARGYKPATLLGLVAGAFLMAGGYLHGDAGVLFGIFMAMAASALWYMAGSPASRRGSTGNVAATLLGVIYVPGLASFAMLLLALPGDVGRNVFLTVVGLTILYDVCAYAVGSWFGNRPLAPTISPSKSWEGAIGATVVLLLVSLAAVPAIDPFTSSTAVGLAILIAIAAPIGDLIESAFKRDLGVKDMGTILPGHGGVLDRIDAILLAAPVAYYFLRIAFL